MSSVEASQQTTQRNLEAIRQHVQLGLGEFAEKVMGVTKGVAAVINAIHDATKAADEFGKQCNIAGAALTRAHLREARDHVLGVQHEPDLDPRKLRSFRALADQVAWEDSLSTGTSSEYFVAVDEGASYTANDMTVRIVAKRHPDGTIEIVEQERIDAPIEEVRSRERFAKVIESLKDARRADPFDLFKLNNRRSIDMFTGKNRRRLRKTRNTGRR